MARSLLALVCIASLAPCVASAQSDADMGTVANIRSFQSRFFSAFDSKEVGFLSAPIETHWCRDHTLNSFPWQEVFVETLLRKWGLQKDKLEPVSNDARSLVLEQFLPLAYEMAEADDGACSLRTFYTVSNKLMPDEQQRLRNWLPTVHAPGAHAQSAPSRPKSQQHEGPPAGQLRPLQRAADLPVKRIAVPAPADGAADDTPASAPAASASTQLVPLPRPHPTHDMSDFCAMGLRPGSRGEAVMAVQRALVTLKLLPEKSVTGLFGPQTLQAIRRLQKKGDARGPGIMSPQTCARLNATYAAAEAAGSFK
jgi:Putative peptidoglycan binding domain